MNVSALFSQIIEKLKRGERPLVKLTGEELTELQHFWEAAREKKSLEEIHQVLCILDNTQTLSPLFDELIIETLGNSPDDETLIFTLSVAGKHIMGYRMRAGEPIPGSFVDALGKLLAHKNAEVLEWTLRTIAELGRAARRLRPLILEHRPGFSAIFNVHKRHAQEIVDHILATTLGGP